MACELTTSWGGYQVRNLNGTPGDWATQKLSLMNMINQNYLEAASKLPLRLRPRPFKIKFRLYRLGERYSRGDIIWSFWIRSIHSIQFQWLLPMIAAIFLGGCGMHQIFHFWRPPILQTWVSHPGVESRKPDQLVNMIALTPPGNHVCSILMLH